MNREYFFLLFILNCSFYLQPILAMEKSLEKMKESTVASICSQFQDPYQALVEIEKHCLPTIQMLTEFLSIAEFSKHIRTLLCKMRTIDTLCAFGNPDEVLRKTMFTHPSPLMQEFMLRRYAATYDWETELKELGDGEYEYLQKRQRDCVSSNRMRVSVMPECLKVTYDAKKIIEIRGNIVFGRSLISASNKCAILGFAIEKYFNFSGFGKRPDDAIFAGIFDSPQILCVFQNSAPVDVVKMANTKTNYWWRPADIYQKNHFQFSQNDEFLLFLNSYAQYTYLIDLNEKSIHKIEFTTNEWSEECLGSVFSVDAAVLCILLSKSEQKSCSVWVIDTFSKCPIARVRISFSFPQAVYAMPDDNSLIVKAGDSYQIYKKKSYSHHIFRKYCAYLLSARPKLVRIKKSFALVLVMDWTEPNPDIADLMYKRLTFNVQKNNDLAEVERNVGAPQNNIILPIADDYSHYKNYLSLDATGMHAVIVADILAKIEDYFGEPIVKHFDVITGSGFGAVVALGTVASTDGSNPLLSLHKIRDTFLEKRSLIFDVSGRAAKRPFYDNKNVRAIFRGMFDNTRLSNCLAHFVLPVHIKIRDQVHPFSYSRDRAQMREIDDIDLARLALYATADSKFFPVVETQHYTCRAPAPCSIGASQVYRNSGAQYIFDEYINDHVHGSSEPTVRVLSISPHLSTEASQRTHNLFKQRLSQNYMHLHASSNDVVKEPDNCAREVLDSYLSASDSVWENAEAFLRKIKDSTQGALT